jgi:hypothetical protein
VHTTAVADIAQPKHSDAYSHSCSCLCWPDVPPERVLIAAAAVVSLSLSLAVCSYPLLPALLLLLRAPAQGFQLMPNTELLISYGFLHSFSVLKIRPTRVPNYSTPLSILGFSSSERSMMHQTHSPTGNYDYEQWS